jgi:hypothetical protein
MNISGFNKPEPKGGRKTKASSKWINRVKTAAQSTPDFSQMADNPLLKAAVICRDNNFTLQISDFVGVAGGDTAFIASMIAVINKMQKENPSELEAFKQKAVKDGLDIISKNRTGGDSTTINKHAAEEETAADLRGLAPHFEPMKRPTFSRHFPDKPVSPPKNPQVEELVQLIEKVRLAIAAQQNSEATPTENKPEIIAVEVEGTWVEMTRTGYEIWKRNRDEINRRKKSAPPANTGKAERRKTRLTLRVIQS